ncbi:ABC transporter substrate-binding protein [Roseospira visakhapatnamensis]|uniref:NitT/TauT family transport system substrate-binding protein n=1 Tax=Roseospira visakhapatnamensis TaxID=390880 RepID=A0A7W6WAH2_9PROT|nr:ABC transporter substrate-binding protein [Roseospira visakhapatnamensis]MBB4266492.1 NitT/TauT family transport system substrate-binding protein [Roseospira visakhapatnamensis]
MVSLNARSLGLAGAVVAIAIGVAVILARGVFDAGVTPPPTLAPLTIGATQGETASLILVAEQRGYFSDASLDVTIMPQPYGRIAAENLFSGTVDLATFTDFVFARNSRHHADLRLLASLVQAYTTHVVARRDHGITQPDDLRGRRVGVTAGTSGEFFLARFLLFHRLPADAINTVNLTPAAIIKALAAGTIDAAVTWQPHVHAVRQRLGDEMVTLTESFETPYYMLLVTTEPWLTGHREEATRFMRALARAQSYIRDNPDELKRLFKDHMNRDPAYIAATWDGWRIRLSLSQDVLTALEDQGDWMVENSLMSPAEVPRYLDMIDSDALSAVYPDAITLIQ